MHLDASGLRGGEFLPLLVANGFLSDRDPLVARHLLSMKEKLVVNAEWEGGEEGG